jgi:DNA invertase Pin-like site-specific DNA recombinase
MTLRAIIWAAVSTTAQADEDEHYSLAAQEADGRALCEREGWQIVDVLRVPGHSRDYKTLEKLAADARARSIDAFDKLIAHFEAADFDVFICRDANRFARSPSLIHQIIEYIIDDCGARIYSFNDGWIDAHNSDIFAMVKAYTTRKEMRWIREMLTKGKDKLAERGLPAGQKPMMAHVVVRDPINGRALRLELDDSKRRLWDDLATLILEGVGWVQIEAQLYQRFGHVNERGQPYAPGQLRHCVLTPQFWGHTARHWYTPARTRNDYEWLYDESARVPDGVLMFRNTCPPVYTGELAARVKAELKRRRDIYGRRRPNTTYRYSGLIRCAECGSTLAVRANRGKRYGVMCVPGSRPLTRRSACSQRNFVRQPYLDAYFAAILEKLLEGDLPDILAQQTEAPAVPASVALVDVQAEAERLHRQIERLIMEQASAAESIQPIYRQQLQALADRLTILDNEAHRLKHRAQSEQALTEVQTLTIDEIRAMTLEAFWKLPEHEINQRLRILLGNHRLVASDGKICGYITED